MRRPHLGVGEDWDVRTLVIGRIPVTDFPTDCGISIPVFPFPSCPRGGRARLGGGD